jgi:mannose/cellobiose epimerase-like protein (N-acyl-D-glucosamine 2-epimerase family)
MDFERERERAQLGDQIEALREQAERQSADHRQALAVLTDQREKAIEPPRRGLWARLMG